MVFGPKKNFFAADFCQITLVGMNSKQIRVIKVSLFDTAFFAFLSGVLNGEEDEYFVSFLSLWWPIKNRVRNLFETEKPKPKMMNPLTRTSSGSC